MILQTDLVIAVRVITVLTSDETPNGVNERLKADAQNIHEHFARGLETHRCDKVDQSAGGMSATTTVVQE